MGPHRQVLLTLSTYDSRARHQQEAASPALWRASERVQVRTDRSQEPLGNTFDLPLRRLRVMARDNQLSTTVLAASCACLALSIACPASGGMWFSSCLART